MVSDNVCMFCKEEIFYRPAESAEREGHIYSEAGLREFGITRLCEFCFDEATKEPDEKYNEF